jgi:hypothetical protein
VLIVSESQTCVCLAVQVVDRVLLEVELLLPLVRVSLACMSVDSLQLLQAEAIGELLSLADGFCKFCSVNACMCPASTATQPQHAAFLSMSNTMVTGFWTLDRQATLSKVATDFCTPALPVANHPTVARACCLLPVCCSTCCVLRLPQQPRHPGGRCADHSCRQHLTTLHWGTGTPV